MMNKNFYLLVSFVFLSLISLAQSDTRPSNCGTGMPPQQWEDWFQAQIEKHQSQKNKQQINTVIPVIVHVIHFGETVGTYPNIDSNQVKSQIAVLNADFAGVGKGINKVPSY